MGLWDLDCPHPSGWRKGPSSLTLASRAHPRLTCCLLFWPHLSLLSLFACWARYWNMFCLLFTYLNRPLVHSTPGLYPLDLHRRVSPIWVSLFSVCSVTWALQLGLCSTDVYPLVLCLCPAGSRCWRHTCCTSGCSGLLVLPFLDPAPDNWGDRPA